MSEQFAEAAIKDWLIEKGLTQEQADLAVITVMDSIEEVLDEYIEEMEQ